MKNIFFAFQEIRKAYKVIKVFDSLMNSFIVTAVFGLMLSFFNIHPLFYLPIFIISFLAFFKLGSKSEIILAEKKVPELREKLRTAMDNINRNDILVERLNQEVLASINKLKFSHFLETKKTIGKLFTLCTICTLIILASSISLRTGEIKIPVLGTINFESGKITDLTIKFGESYEELEDQESSRNIYGNESIAELGNKQLDLRINPTDSEIDLSDIRDTENKEFKSGSPEGIEATSDSSYSEKISKEHQEIVKRYFNKISGEKNG